MNDLKNENILQAVNKVLAVEKAIKWSACKNTFELFNDPIERILFIEELSKNSNCNIFQEDLNFYNDYYDYKKFSVGGKITSHLFGFFFETIFHIMNGFIIAYDFILVFIKIAYQKVIIFIKK